MADIKISALPGASTLDGTETIPLVQGGTTKQTTASAVWAMVNPSYTGTLTGGTGVVNLGSGQLYKDGSGNVGLGTTSPNYSLTSYKGGAVANYLQVASGATGAAAANGLLVGIDSTGAGVLSSQGASGNLKFWTAGVQRAAIDNAGNLGLGTASPSTRLHVNSGASTSTATLESTGTSAYAQFKNSGASAFIGADSTGAFQIQTPGSGYSTKFTVDATGHTTPGSDNTQTLGSGALRWSTVYAGTGTINTSDAREKTDVRVMAADEIEAAKALSKEIGIYQFLDSVAKKGDKARHHVGLTVQRAIELMKLHGLDPFAYGLICFDKWDDVVVEHPAVEAKAATEAKDAVVDDEGNVIEAAVEAQDAIEAKDAWTEVTLKAGDRYSFRYDQLNLFIARGIEARLAALEAK